MKKLILIATMLLSLTGMRAQQVSEIYEELPNPVATDASKWARVTNPIIAWGSTDVRYNKELPAQVTPLPTMNLTGWMGEKLSAQFVISTNRDLKNVSVEVSDIVAKNYKISKWNTERGFVRYVMTDELGRTWVGEGETKPIIHRDWPLKYDHAQNTLAGPHWFERMIADRKQDVLDMAAAAMPRR
jgi:hypothetical protein